MGTTSRFAFPYPEQGDVPNVQADIKSLANAVDAALNIADPPVVNGQWLKGVGGIPVWTAIADTDIPALGSTPPINAIGRLAAKAPQNFADWNSAVDSGWYTTSTAANPPITGGHWFLARVETHDNTAGNLYVTQTAWTFTEGAGPISATYTRRCVAGTWSAWTQIFIPTDNVWHSVGTAGEPGFQGSWGVLAGWPNPAFRKFPNGLVYCRGLANGGVAGTAIWTMPVGYRPGDNYRFLCNDGWSLTSIEVQTAGNLQCQSRTTNNWVDLGCISYYAEN